MKCVGAIFLLLIYLNADTQLMKQDRDTDRLRLLFGPGLSWRWMLLDAFANSWVVSVCSMALPCVLWCAEDVRGVVLDAFGLLFLYNLDEYSADLSLDIDENDFEKLMEQIAEGVKGMQGDSKGMECLPHAADHVESDCEKIFIKFFKYGDFFFAIGRLVNFISCCFYLPAYLLVFWPSDVESDAIVEDTEWMHLFIFRRRDATRPFITFVGTFFIFLMSLLRVRMFFIIRDCCFLSPCLCPELTPAEYKSSSPYGRERQDLRNDPIAFFFEVFMPRATDPRLPIDEFDKARAEVE